jgi:hypothetical protein
MGETRYPLGEKDSVRFGYDDCRYSCLCTFPFNNSKRKFGLSTVESFALLGATLCMYRNGGLIKNEYDYEWDDRHEYVVPECLPEWVRNEIRRTLGDYPEEFDVEDIKEIDIDEDELYRNKLVKIKEWAERELKELDESK